MMFSCGSDQFQEHAVFLFFFTSYLSDIFAVLVLIAYQTLKTLRYHIDRQLEPRRNAPYAPLFFNFLSLKIW